MREDSHPLKNRAILLAEDDYFIMSALRQSFEAQGAEIVGPAPTVSAALSRVAAALRLDAAVLDINLQGEMAFSVADALTERSVPFMFVTGYDSASMPDRFRNVPFCEKPVQPREVIQRLAHLIGE